MKISQIVSAIFCLLLFGNVLPAQDGKAGTESPLMFGAGARAMGMGRAYVALVDDPTAVFWNPSGLENVPRMSLSLFHTSLYEGTTYDFIGFSYPTLQYGTVGVGLTRLATGDIPIRDEFAVQLGTATYQHSELYIGYAKRLRWNVTGGFTFKINRQQFSFNNQVTSGLGLDVGLLYQPQWESSILRDLQFGFAYQNLISPSLKLGTQSENLPYHLRFGLVKAFPIGLSGRLNIALDYNQSKFSGGNINMGAEYLFRDMGTLRLGFDQQYPTFGAGVRYSFVQIDYSFGNLSYQGDFPPTHRFSITFHIGKSREELVRIAEEERKRREAELVARTKEEERQRFIAEHLQKGMEYLKENRHFDAQAEFQAVILEDPFNKTAQAMLDSVNTLIQTQLEQRQQEAIARAIDKELAEENKRFVQLHFEKGQLYLQKNQFTDALIEFNLALERAPDDPIILEAIRTTQRRLNEQVRRLVSRGREEFQRGNYSEALRILSEALVLAPEDQQLKEEINALANRIKVQQFVQQALQLYDLGEYEKALSLFEEAYKLDPSNETIRMYLERTRRGMGVVKEEMDPESERQYIMGTELFLAGRYEEALEIWRKLAEKYPFNKKVQDAIKNAEDRLRRTKSTKQ